jgi:hypothetical protein
VGVLPRRSELDVEDLTSASRKPALQGFRDELGVVVRADEGGFSSVSERGRPGS